MHDWERMDPAALDDAYANAAYIPGAEAWPDRWRQSAAAFRATARAELNIAYGDAPGAAYDLFRPEGRAHGLVVFVHGGYWRAFDRSDWSHLAAGAVARGWAVAVMGYPLAPSARIAEITAQVARGIDAAAARVAGPVRLTGHSAGGHLAARMVMPDAAPACADRIEACLPLSPVADLRPLVAQSLNDDLRLTPEEAASESPALGTPRPDTRVSVHVGSDERPAFLWQARGLSQAWAAPLHVAAGRHHFDVIDALADSDSAMVDDLLA
ncbi:Alpha/beta hydrolase family protein [Jannaschia seosinensis]|uniref:Alpha/beta hydrolase family protein n=1 Tax=Jannaschia seosinensis TaxID=313367 RepID=A0A0M7BBF8_9RHOB|nr:alpha/beta hydrolase [Jannaschia seosinensis]CUH40117.1 Alpha/beta hydrolase family protein [Jannaschia seosinensis]